MRFLALSLAFFSFCLIGCEKPPPPIGGSDVGKGDARYEAVMALPTGIEVTHNPEQVLAEEGGRSPYQYTWLHSTSVRSTVGELTLIEFGAFDWRRGRWEFGNYTGKPFSPEEFAEWYSCPQAVLRESETYADPKNWSGADRLQASFGLWYFIGEDAEGKRYKGLAQVDTLAKLKAEGEGVPEG